MEIKRQLERGMSGQEVRELQQFLNKAGFTVASTGAGSPGNETEFFGPATEAAVKKYQSSMGIVSSGDPQSTGYGRVGPRTLKSLQGYMTSSFAPGSLVQFTPKSDSATVGEKTIGSYKGVPVTSGTDVEVQDQIKAIDSKETTIGSFASPAISPVISPVVTPQIVATPPATPPVTTTGNPQLDELYGVLKDFVSKQTINPNVQLTPADLQRFYDQASAEISPYYASQISAIKDDLTKNIGFLQKNYELEKQQAGAQLKNTLASSREEAAGAGTIFSGARGRQERDLASLYEQNLENKALGLESQIGGTLRGVESKIGSKNIQDLGIPSFQSSGVSLEGRGGLTPGRNLSFSPTGGVTGSIEYQQRGDIRSLQDLLSSEEIKKRSRTANMGGLYL